MFSSSRAIKSIFGIFMALHRKSGMVACSHVTPRYNHSVQSPSESGVHFVAFCALVAVVFSSREDHKRACVLSLSIERDSLVQRLMRRAILMESDRRLAHWCGHLHILAIRLPDTIRLLRRAARVLFSYYGCACRGEDMDKLRNLFAESDASSYVPGFVCLTRRSTKVLLL